MQSLQEFRTGRSLSLEQLALDLGLRSGSKGHLSRIESGLEPCPLRLALAIEALSDGAVPASSIVSEEDRALLARRDAVAVAPLMAEASA